jgi:hypothetical protein
MKSRGSTLMNFGLWMESLLLAVASTGENMSYTKKKSVRSLRHYYLSGSIIF